jgi:hypothetical protein
MSPRRTSDRQADRKVIVAIAVVVIRTAGQAIVTCARTMSGRLSWLVTADQTAG